LFKRERIYCCPDYLPRSSCVVSKRRSSYGFQVFVSEQTRGDIILKTWESSIAESRKMAKEVKESCEEAFHSLKKESLGLDK
jgi:hypothetical protein